jgi:hypothetical protein
VLRAAWQHWEVSGVADWVVCPGCRLKHARRPNGACPRCHAPIDEAERGPQPSAAVPALPQVFDEAAFADVAARRQAAAAPDDERLLLAERIAGGILLGNGVLQLSLRALEPAADAVFALVTPWAAAFDLVVGAVLLSGQAQVRRWTIVRLLLGLALFSCVFLVRGHWFDLMMQAAFAGGLLLLMVRRATARGLQILGAGGASAATLVAALTVAPFLGVVNPFGLLSDALNGETSWAPTYEISGRRIGFKLALSDQRWHLVNQRDVRSTEAQPEQAEDERGVRQESSAIVRRPDSVAELQVVAIQAPSTVALNEGEIIDELVEHQRDQLLMLLVVDDSWIDTAQGSMRVLEGNADVEGRRVGVALGFAVHGQCVFMLAGTAPQRMFPRVRDELVRSFAALEAPGCTI